MEQVNEKASYCLNCKIKPCSLKGCPLGNNIPEFIKQIKEENYDMAYKVLSETTVLQGVCGRICPHKKQCQGSCVRGIKGEPVSIGDLEAFTFDKAMENKISLSKCWEKEIKESSKKNVNKKVAIIGGGPAGLTASSFLAKEGIKVTIYEKYDYLGGLLVHGIPKFRLSKEVVKQTVDNILGLGIEVKYNMELGKNLHLEDLQKEYDAIFLCFGANVSSKMGIEGENLQGVYGGNELLEYNMHPNYEGKTVLVNGGGNVAMDCARTIKRMGAKEVKVVYRRAIEQMPAEEKEVEEAMKEGVEFLFQNNIVRIIGSKKDNIINSTNNQSKTKYKNIENLENMKDEEIEGNVAKVELIKTQLVQKEGEERLVPVNVENSNYTLEADYVVMALGSKPAPFVENLGLKLNRWGNIEVNENYQTSNPKIYAGGDLAGEKGTVAWAAKSGREAAKAIIKGLEI